MELTLTPVQPEHLLHDCLQPLPFSRSLEQAHCHLAIQWLSSTVALPVKENLIEVQSMEKVKLYKNFRITQMIPEVNLLQWLP